MRKQSVWNIVLTVWFSESISFSIFTSFGTISGNFDIFSLFSLFHGLNHLNLQFTSEVHCGGWKLFVQVDQPWNSRELTMTNPRNVVRTGKSHAFRPSQQKKMKNIKINRESRENKTEKKILLWTRWLCPHDDIFM